MKTQAQLSAVASEELLGSVLLFPGRSETLGFSAACRPFPDVISSFAVSHNATDCIIFCAAATRRRKRPPVLFSDSPRYWSRFCDWSYMPLESCRHCGYALSVLDHHCRHCASALSAGPTSRFDVKNLPQIIAALVGLGLLVYFIFLHGFS